MREQWDPEETDTVASRAECALLGSFLISPYMLDKAATLEGRDFSSIYRRHIFETMRSFPRRNFDATLLACELERRLVPPPPGVGWFTAIGVLMDSTAPDDAIDEYVEHIRAAAILRKRGRDVSSS